MKSIAAVLMSSLFIPWRWRETRFLGPAAKKLAEPVKNRQARSDEASCKRKGGDFSPGAEFCVFSGIALRCEMAIRNGRIYQPASSHRARFLRR
jgi:hypothetical protein